MRTIKGIEVPEWFMTNRPPDDNRFSGNYNPEPFNRVYAGYGWLVQEDLTLKKIVDLIGNQDPSLVAVQLQFDAMNEKCYLELTPFTFKKNDKFDSELKEFIEWQERVRLWHELKKKIDGVVE